MSFFVMGIVNVTPDSFSDGGMYFDSAEAIKRAKNMLDDGADIIDLGGESTRPGAVPISHEEEWLRLSGVIGEVVRMCERHSAKVSVDTYHVETATKAVALGVKMINCVYPMSVNGMMKIIANNPEVELVIPATVVESDPGFLDRLSTDVRQRIIIDPMIGFNTTREEDLELLKNISRLSKKAPVMVGASRKRIVKKLTGEKMTGKNLGGNLAIALWSAINGASIVRVHDVKETRQALNVLTALISSSKE